MEVIKHKLKPKYLIFLGVSLICTLVFIVNIAEKVNYKIEGIVKNKINNPCCWITIDTKDFGYRGAEVSEETFVNAVKGDYIIIHKTNEEDRFILSVGIIVIIILCILILSEIIYSE